jgi:hypothetical protein
MIRLLRQLRSSLRSSVLRQSMTSSHEEKTGHVSCHPSDTHRRIHHGTAPPTTAPPATRRWYTLPGRRRRMDPPPVPRDHGRTVPP